MGYVEGTGSTDVVESGLSGNLKSSADIDKRCDEEVVLDPEVSRDADCSSEGSGARDEEGGGERGGTLDVYEGGEGGWPRNRDSGSEGVGPGKGLGGVEAGVVGEGGRQGAVDGDAIGDQENPLVGG